MRSMKSPGFFAYPAALGDIAVGLTACVAVIALIWSTVRLSDQGVRAEALVRALFEAVS